MSLRDEIAATWCLEFYGQPLILSSEFRVNIAMQVADAIIAIPELKQALEDAERYQWLRDGNNDVEGVVPALSGEWLDEAIDKARGICLHDLQRR